MKYFKPFAALACSAVFALSFSACAVVGDNPQVEGKSTQLGNPKAVTSISYEEQTSDSFTQFKDKVEQFASSFAAYAYAAREYEDNFAVSPISVYMALSLAAECADGKTQEQILNALGVTHTQLKENYPLLYRSLAVEHKVDKEISGMLMPSNSIWVNDGTPVNQSCIDALSEYYYAYSYSADFKNDNAAANSAVREFVKDKTNGIIDKDFELSDDTLFVLINTLYLKTIWNDDGGDLRAWGKRDFVNADGTKKNTELLKGNSRPGRVYKADTYSTFYTSTFDGYKIKFILPNEGYSVDDVFTSENISAVNGLKDYGSMDEENKIRYYTGCIFPEYKCKFDYDIKDILKDKYGISDLFNMQLCDFSNLSPKACFCSKVQHVTDLTVDKQGIEGAAVTAIMMDATSVGPDDYEIVYEDFFIDKAFGFILTDRYDVTLFSGVVNSL